MLLFSEGIAHKENPTGTSLAVTNALGSVPHASIPLTSCYSVVKMENNMKAMAFSIMPGTSNVAQICATCFFCSGCCPPLRKIVRARFGKMCAWRCCCAPFQASAQYVFRVCARLLFFFFCADLRSFCAYFALVRCGVECKHFRQRRVFQESHVS